MLCSPPPATTLASSCDGWEGFCAPCCRRSSQRSRIHNRPKTGRTLLLHERQNNPQVIVALILVLAELVRGPGASALTSAEAEDAVDEIEAGNDAVPLEHCRRGAD